MLDYKYYQGGGLDHIILLHGIGGDSQIFYKQIDEYKNKFNVLAIHLPGHGKSPDTDAYEKKFTYDLVVEEIGKTMDFLGIREAHFVGISLGTIIIHHILQKEPERVISVVLGGTITGFNLFSKTLLLMGRLIKGVTPFMLVYSLFANIMMPRRNHKKSRELFIREAQKMTRSNFLSWFDLIRNADTTYQTVQEASGHIPKLYISGDEDHLFVKVLEKDIKGDANAQMIILNHCGHVCNIEKPQEFNLASLTFIEKHRRVSKEVD